MHLDLQAIEVRNHKPLGAGRYCSDGGAAGFGTAIRLTVEYKAPTVRGVMPSGERPNVNG